MSNGNKAITIKTESVQSSQINSVGWEDGILQVEFKGGSKYIYINVNEYVYEAMINALSIGSFFSKYIKSDSSIKCVRIS